jgi:hypothetical protein
MVILGGDKVKKIVIIILIILLAIIVIGFKVLNKSNNKVDLDNKSIPYLPLNHSNIDHIGLNGYSHSKGSSNDRTATKEEETQIVNWLNNIEKYDKKSIIPKYGNGKPDPSNIQIFTRNNPDNGNYMYILEEGNDSIIISRPQSGIGYIVRQTDINSLLKQLRQ